MSVKRVVISLAAAGGLALAGCGSSTGDRAASGAGIGAGAGAVVGAVTGLSVLQGVVIGAAAGGLLGAVTDADMLNLGEPIWADSGSGKSANKAAVARVQGGLSRLGYAAGPTDGVMGPQTRTAIRSYQSDHKLLVDGRATQELAAHIDSQIQLTASR